MSYAGIQMFMEKLKQLINGSHIPLFNNPEVIYKRPQFQLLYDELGTMIQTLFVHQHQHQDLEQLDNLKRRFIYAAEEAEYNVDLFLSGVHFRNNSHSPTSGNFNRSINLDDVRRSFKSMVNQFLSCVHIRNTTDDFPACENFSPSLNLDDVSGSFKSIEEEFESMKIDGMKMDSSQRPQTTLNQSVAGQNSIIVGIDRDAEVIRDKLVEDQKKLDVVSIVGMGGIGKTTLATKVFNDGYIEHHFYVRVWVTVSQTYDKRAVLTQILDSMGVKLDPERDPKKVSDSPLRELVHKNLMGKRYLIVIDDIWQKETWDNMKLFFPDNNNGSRILLTSRLTEVAKHAKSNGLIYHLGYLNNERSWELLCQKVFQGNECPEWSIKHGMQIVENCHGLPLAVVVIAGVLAKEAWSEEFWLKIADRTGSYIVSEENGCLETLALSYSHLPLHLRECFLYLGGFAEDYEFQVRQLIWLWVAEGFIEIDGNRSLEDTAEGYLIDLIDRNLVVASGRGKSNGVVKACKVHDLVRELCLRKAKEERFINKTERLMLSPQFSDVITQPCKPVRMFINNDMNILGFPYSPTQSVRSILWFNDFRSLSDIIANGFRSFELLRVLDLQNCRLNGFPKGMELLVHLRYLSVLNLLKGFPSSICNLWGLQTLIYTTKELSIDLPSNISDLINLRHLWCLSYYDYRKLSFFLPSIEKPMKNLQTISGVVLGDEVDNFQKCFPYIKELRCGTSLDEQNEFKSLTNLEKLHLIGSKRMDITFPTTLRTLKIERCSLPWSAMSIIQSLPNLQVLKLHDAFYGSCWNTGEQEFQQLKFLRLEGLCIDQWEAYSISFPCLRQLQISDCEDLEEIPLEIGEIPTLELIQIRKCSRSVGESVRRIEEEQRDLGNYDLKIKIW